MLAVQWRARFFFAIAVAVFPRLYSYIRSLLVRSYDQPHVLAARARGLGSSAIFLRMSYRWRLPRSSALLGVSFAISFGAAIPIEALCDSPVWASLPGRRPSPRSAPHRQCDSGRCSRDARCQFARRSGGTHFCRDGTPSEGHRNKNRAEDGAATF